MLNRKTLSIQIPFCGFHESEAACLVDEVFQEQPPEEVYKEIATQYARLFTTYFIENTGLKVSIDFKDLTSPKYYDEDTDIITGLISPNDAQNLYDHVDMDVLNMVIKDSLGILEGNQLATENWLKPVSDWEPGQLELLLHALLRQSDVDEVDYFKVLSGLKIDKEELEKIRNVSFL